MQVLKNWDDKELGSEIEFQSLVNNPVYFKVKLIYFFGSPSKKPIRRVRCLTWQKVSKRHSKKIRKQQ